jgi:hypothetical protein
VSDEPILGTRVPDNALHRASLWLEDFKRVRERGLHTQARDEQAADLDEFVRIVGVDGKVTGMDLVEGAAFYGNNFVEMIFPRGVDITIIGAQLDAPTNLQSVMFSVWLDGMQHGAAMVAGLEGLSNEEIEQGVDRP